MKAPAVLSTLFIVLVLAAACSTVVWEKPGTTSAELTDDMAACRQVATTTHLETRRLSMILRHRPGAFSVAPL